MPSVATGLANAVRVSTEWVIDPDLGDSIQETWEGLRYQILSLAQGFKQIGAKARVTHRGPRFTLVAVIGQTPARGVEVPVDKYEWDTEQAQVSIFSIPGATHEAAAYVSQAQYRKDIETAVKNGDEFPLSGLFPWGEVIYIMLSRGVESYPVRRLTLRRVRTFSLDYAGRIELSATPVAYTSSALIRDFQIPDKIALQFPENPIAADTPIGTTWSWWMRTDRSEQIPALNKVEETREWVFAAFETALYTIIA